MESHKKSYNIFIGTWKFIKNFFGDGFDFVSLNIW